ncbi:transglycosylase domain-containing protein [Marinomonas mediterranea]|uniref:Penicillin-binding protein 1B n=1 Tax=Marinomonas mediterranea (strain ATCC 700492 / JCM 21426 / NBRC 103028 / MMB-1) TaxID=717774 RepID=F2JTE9_MARM1|nr:transglycosylase domain-containing protein [Marinomonas mediterranea]ADZ90367.1 Peptidoglycan glycosyltransferase [Marinomonas mediterranea MMB-1]WCN16549.1 penicillin-binding protein [Marinomonas mediterranea MMB-1]
MTKRNTPARSNSRSAKPRKTTRKRPPARKKKPTKPSWLKRAFAFWFKWLLLLGCIALLPFMGWLWVLDQEVTNRFEGQKWQVPSEVYSAPVVLKSGSRWTKKELEDLLNDAGYRFGKNSQEVGWAARSRTKVSANLRPYTNADGQHKGQRLIFSFPNGVLKIQSLTGAPVKTAYLEPQVIGYLYGGSSEQREILTYEQIPSTLIEILTATEDRNFFSHHGISLMGIARAAWVNVSHGSRVQGGSTLTQQLVKNMFLTSERTYTRKITEVFMSLLLEYHYSKQEILTAYMNEVYLAQLGSRELRGFAAASRYFFGRPLKELNISEYALLVGMVKGPSLYNPKRNTERAKERRNVVINLLVEQQKLEVADARILKREPIRLSQTNKQRSMFGDYLDVVQMQLERDFDRSVLATENLKIYTGIDVRAQRAATSALRESAKRISKRDNALKQLQGAMVVTDRETGYVKAIVGSTQRVYTGFNRALGAVRPIGSLVKPPIYLSALASGRFTWWSRVEDKRQSINLGGNVWRPENYDRKEHGEVPLYMALAKSYNLATIDLVTKIGFSRVEQVLKDLGVKRPFRMVPSVALGAIELSPFEVARLYQPIASLGESSELGIVLAVLGQDGQVHKRFNRKGSVPFTASALAVAREGMVLVPKLGTAKAAQNVFPSLRFAAKTGTTNNQRDSWYVSITEDTVSTIWLGLDKNLPMSITGSSGAQKVWIDFAKRYSQNSLSDQLPKGASRATVLEDEFEIAADRCDNKITLAFITGTQPDEKRACIWMF